MLSRFLCVGLFLMAGTVSAQSKITWKKTVVDTKFRSEGVAVADVNKDGKADIIVGDFWYEAPDWKPHVLRKARVFDPKNYSESFAVFSDDVDADGFPDAIVVGFPGKPCHWYKNPGKSGDAWKEYMIQDNACNETPIYVDVLGTGKRALVLGHKGEMCFFTAGKDPTKPWDRYSVSGPPKGKEQIPGTHHFAHGLGAGDVNGDGKLDLITFAGWWEQPAKVTGQAWTFHPVKLDSCADIYAFDIDGDGKNDIICSAAHNTGFWWHQQKAGKDGPSFVKNNLFPTQAAVAAASASAKVSKEQAALYAAVNKVRADQKRAPWRLSPELSEIAQTRLVADGKFTYPGKMVAHFDGKLGDEGIKKALEEQSAKNRLLTYPGLEVGVGVGADGKYSVILGDRSHFALPGQTHALHFVDINGDGKKDLVTGRRFWAHGPGGDDHPQDPAFLYWFEAVKDSNGITSFTPHMIDDDSGIGTQFAVEDINGDGIPDVIISNKRGIFVFEQIRAAGSKE